MKKLSIINILAGLAVALIPTVLFPVCSIGHNGMHMGCYYTRILSVAAGACMIILGLLGFVFQKKGIFKLQFLGVAGLALFVYLSATRVIKIGNMQTLGWQVGLCRPGMDMACREHTWPVLSVVLLVIAVANALFFLYSLVVRSKS